MKSNIAIIAFVFAILQMITEPTYVENPALGVLKATTHSQRVEWDNAYDIEEFPFIDEETTEVQKFVETALRDRYYISYVESSEDVFNALVQYQRDNNIYIINNDLDTINLGKLCPLTAKALDIAIY